MTNLNLVRKRFSFIVVTELWLIYDSNLVLDINGYKSHSFSRTGRNSGGINLFHLDYLSWEVISYLSAIEDSNESIFVKAPIPGLGNTYVAGIYQPPNKPVTYFNQFITGTMEYIYRIHTAFAGDFIIDVMINSNVSHIYINTLHQCSFVNEINLPNFISPSNRSAISSTELVRHNLDIPRCSSVVSPALS